MSEREMVLNALGKNDPKTVKDLSIITKLPRDRVRDMLYRIVKDPEHTVEVCGTHQKKTYCYMGRTEMLTHTQRRKDLVERASHLLIALESLTVASLSKNFNIDHAECLEIMAYLVRSGQAEVYMGVVIAILPTKG